MKRMAKAKSDVTMRRPSTFEVIGWKPGLLIQLRRKKMAEARAVMKTSMFWSFGVWADLEASEDFA